jgi:hypothetical protein
MGHVRGGDITSAEVPLFVRKVMPTNTTARVLERTTDNLDIQIDDARLRLLRAEAAGVEEALDDVLGRMRETVADLEEERALVAGLIERLVALRAQECGVARVLRMRRGE